MLREVCRYARGVRLAEGQRTRAGFHQQAVGVAVVAAFELDDFIATGKATGQTDGAHGRFGTGVHHAHHIHGRHQFGHQRGHFHFHLGWRAEAQAALGCFNHRIADTRVVMAKHHRAPGADVVDIGFAIHIVQVRAIGTFDKQRCTAHAGKSTYGGVHTARDKFAGRAVKSFRLAHGVVPGFGKRM
ncbi:hypothetical protein D3C75_313060 [compost metagenome]